MKQKVLFDDQMIVITGAAGFIGSAVVRYLNDRKRNNLVLVDDLGEKGTWKNLVGKDFIEIIEDLTPDSMDHIKMISGAEDESAEE